MNKSNNVLQTLVLHYDFTEVSSTIVPDISGAGAAGVIRGYDRGGAETGSDMVFGNKRNVLLLSGGENGGYLQLPDGIAHNRSGITISFFCKLNAIDSYGQIFSFGADQSLYLSAMPSEEDGLFLLSPGATKGGRSQEAAFEKWFALPLHTWFHVSVTFTGTTPAICTLYIDGKNAGSVTHRRMDSTALTESRECCFGTGFFANRPLGLSLTDVYIYNTVLPEQAITTRFSVADSTRTVIDLDALSALFAHPVSDNLSLPEKGTMYSKIHWDTETPEFIDTQGNIRRPAPGEGSGAAVLKATASYNEARDSRLFNFSVLPLPMDDEIAKADVFAIDFSFPGHISGDLLLPCTGENGTCFNWVITGGDKRPSDLVGYLLKKADKKKESVTLKVTGTYASGEYSREFHLVMWPASGHLPEASLFSNNIYIPPEYEVPEKTSSLLPMQDISLLEISCSLSPGNLFLSNRRRCTDYLLLLDDDRMLYNFRKAFGRDTRNALPLGGWEEPAGLLRGHSMGHYLSALAFAYASTKDSRYCDKADYLVGELRSLQLESKGRPEAFTTKCTPGSAAQSGWSRSPETWGEGFLSAYSPDQFALLEQYTPYATIWAPYYTLHKLIAGFMDCYEQAGNSVALECAAGIGSWVYHRLAATTKEQRNAMWEMYIAGEYGGMNESLAHLYKLTGEEQFLKAAKFFDNSKIFDGLAEGIDTIWGLHANQHIPQILGALEEYEATGNDYYYHVAEHFFGIVLNHHMYSIGGVGRGENFKEPDMLAANIESDRNCETCAAYNLLKLAGRLYCYAPDESVYMDYYERTMINQIAASQNPNIKKDAHNRVTYMLPIGPGARKEYSNDYEDFTCCHGTGMENHVRYTENIYHKSIDNNTLYVNLFLASEYSWKEKGVRLLQENVFPSDKSRLTIHGYGTFTLKIRIPYWCRSSFGSSINGEKIAVPDDGSNYLTIKRTFLDGDTIELFLPYTVHLSMTADRPGGDYYGSIMYGPLVMTALDGGTDFITLNLPPNPGDAFMIDTNENMPVLHYDDLKFVPMYAAHDVNYHTYFKINFM